MAVAEAINPAAGTDSPLKTLIPPGAALDFLVLSGDADGLAGCLADFGGRFRTGPLILKIKNIDKNNVKNIEVYIK
jgi:hypothetical protein